MSQIEDNVKPTLVQILEQPACVCRLSLEQRLTLATWCTTKSIVIDYEAVTRYQGDRPFFTPRQRDRFVRELIPPEGVGVWIARLASGSPTRVDIIASNVSHRVRESKHLNAKVVTYGIGELAIQLVAYRRLRGKKGTNKSFPFAIQPSRGYSWDQFALKIWPDEGDIGWPPSQQLPSTVLSVSGFEMFGNRLGGLKSLRPRGLNVKE